MDMETERKFFVYVDFREDDGKPFYVGKGLNSRVKLEKRNPLHANIKNKHGMVRKIVLETHDEQEALQKEIELIQELKTHVDFGVGGANFTLGGDGTSGYKHIDESKEKMRESLKERWEDPEYKLRISEAIKKAWEDPEFKEKMGENSKKMWEDPEHKKLISDSMKKVWEDPDHKEKVSDAIKQHHNDPEFRKKQGKKMREVLSDPEIREKISRITKEKLSDPEIKKKISENVKLGISKLTPEQRSERIRKGWETRRLQKLQQES